MAKKVLASTSKTIDKMAIAKNTGKDSDRFFRAFEALFAKPDSFLKKFGVRS